MNAPLTASELSYPSQSLASMRERLQSVWQRAEEFIASDVRDGHLTGELSTSALSTATAISALSLCEERNALQEVYGDTGRQAIAVGCAWLAAHQNSDGGFGDTNRSHSNIATSLLVQAAWKLAKFEPDRMQRDRLQQYIASQNSWDGLRRRYGKDKTFVVPILTNCALAGIAQWKQVPALPFEAAWLPQSWYRLARMPVVSYAVPALVAIGQVKFHFQPPLNPLVRALRHQAIEPTLRVLRSMQPDSGGYLEAVPLTSFVLMSLAGVGKLDLQVARDCIRFTMDSRLSDGSWPIDTNLATWVTSLSVVARRRRTRAPLRLASEDQRADSSLGLPRPAGLASSPTALASSPWITAQTLRWLLKCQHLRRHPFTGARPGGWGWTNLSGAVPDADDTPAALLAIASIDLNAPENLRLRHQSLCAVARGLRWIVELQNRDGGWPTFCKGWGKLPFDRSGTDLTAHALRAIRVWQPQLETLQRLEPSAPLLATLERATQRGLRYLERSQRADGSWLPLWFGNQDRAGEENPIYGTSKTLIALLELGLEHTPMATCGLQYLVGAQNGDGGWGGGASVPYKSGIAGARALQPVHSSIEETALALEALLQCGGVPLGSPTIMRGLEWLCATIEMDNLNCSWPIGFYFAKLWYHERLYPAIFSLAALGKALERLESNETDGLTAG